MRSSVQVFVSYAWKAEVKLVDCLCEALERDGFDVQRDRDKLGYKHSIGDFMDRLGRGEAVVAVLSKEYFESKYCMRELLDIYRHRSFRERIFPVLLPDCGISSAEDRLRCAEFWKAQIDKLNEQIKGLGYEKTGEATHEEIRLMAAFASEVDDILATVADLNLLTPEALAASDFSLLREKLRAVHGPAPRPSSGPISAHRAASDLLILLVEFYPAGSKLLRRYRDAAGLFGEEEVGTRQRLEEKVRALDDVVERPEQLDDPTLRQAYGECLFWLLFGDRWSGAMNRVFGRGAHPTRGALRVRILEHVSGGDRPLLDRLPWRLTTWKGQLLTQNVRANWQFEIAPIDAPARPKRMEAPARVVIVAPLNLSGLPTETHVASLQQIIQRSAEGTSRTAESLVSVVRTFSDFEKVTQPPPDVVYYFGQGGEPGLLFDRGRGLETVTFLRFKAALNGRDGHFPSIVYLNGCRTGLDRSLFPEVPVVIAEPVKTFSDGISQAALHWFERVFAEAKCPIESVHSIAPDTYPGYSWATTTVATHCERFEVKRAVPTGRVLVRHSLDRSAQRGIALSQINALVQHGERRLQAFVGWGTRSDAPDLLNTQLLEHAKQQAHGPPAIRRLAIRLPEEREELEKGLVAEVRAQLGLEDPNTNIRDGIYRKAPSGTGTMRPVLWLDFGVYGDPVEDDRVYGPGLGVEDLRAWWSTCCHGLAPFCPPHVRMVAVIGVVPSNLEDFHDFLEAEYLLDPTLQHPSFHATLLPPLGQVRLSDFRDFLSEPEARCPPELRLELARLILRDTGGEYARAIERLDEGMKGWPELYRRLSAGAPTSRRERNRLL